MPVLKYIFRVCILLVLFNMGVVANLKLVAESTKKVLLHGLDIPDS